jgi:hypothetical protein
VKCVTVRADSLGGKPDRAYVMSLRFMRPSCKKLGNSERWLSTYSSCEAWYIKIQFAPHRKHNLSPAPTG